KYLSQKHIHHTHTLNTKTLKNHQFKQQIKYSILIKNTIKHSEQPPEINQIREEYSSLSFEKSAFQIISPE
ncbi:hypothetical protein, partial [Citrobacter freundii]|uniref:hypothetical protein n=1 Tax=Citrobacter freundii TaxID=546 RepID=UPI00207CACDE